MIESLSISHFRAFEKLELKPLNRVNLIAGNNNIGKTGILEAVYLTNGNGINTDAFEQLFRRIQGGEKDNVDNFWSWLFNKKDFSKSWSISANGKFPTRGFADVRDNRIKHLLTNSQSLNSAKNFHWSQKDVAVWKQNDSPSLNIFAINTQFSLPADDAELVNAIAVKNEEDELIEYLRLIEPRLKKLKYLKLPGHNYAYAYADIGFGPGKELIPATQLGQGFARMLNLFATLMVKGTQILLIDEFENGLQHDALVPVWEALGKIARQRDIQIFATTHSYENIQAAHEAFSKTEPYDLSVIKLRREKDGEIAAVIADREMIETALENNFEIR